MRETETINKATGGFHHFWIKPANNFFVFLTKIEILDFCSKIRCFPTLAYFRFSLGFSVPCPLKYDLHLFSQKGRKCPSFAQFLNFNQMNKILNTEYILHNCKIDCCFDNNMIAAKREQISHFWSRGKTYPLAEQCAGYLILA